MELSFESVLRHQMAMRFRGHFGERSGFSFAHPEPRGQKTRAPPGGGVAFAADLDGTASCHRDGYVARTLRCALRLSPWSLRVALPEALEDDVGAGDDCPVLVAGGVLGSSLGRTPRMTQVPATKLSDVTLIGVRHEVVVIAMPNNPWDAVRTAYRAVPESGPRIERPWSHVREGSTYRRENPMKEVWRRTEGHPQWWQRSCRWLPWCSRSGS